ncbi:MAG TPA: DNA gyrase inhibitor YacG [Vicinamibacterales bacterium]|nr:DNA gyrase inhibitor YacG [Vicinamibacterales bacterium]
MRSEPLCAYCRKQPADPAWAPFCSERCRMADLGHWLSGDYRVPGDPPPAADTGGPDDDADDV